MQTLHGGKCDGCRSRCILWPSDIIFKNATELAFFLAHVHFFVQKYSTHETERMQRAHRNAQCGTGHLFSAGKKAHIVALPDKMRASKYNSITTKFGKHIFTVHLFFARVMCTYEQ